MTLTRCVCGRVTCLYFHSHHRNTGSILCCVKGKCSLGLSFHLEFDGIAPFLLPYCPPRNRAFPSSLPSSRSAVAPSLAALVARGACRSSPSAGALLKKGQPVQVLKPVLESNCVEPGLVTFHFPNPLPPPKLPSPWKRKAASISPILLSTAPAWGPRRSSRSQSQPSIRWPRGGCCAKSTSASSPSFSCSTCVPLWTGECCPPNPDGADTATPLLIIGLKFFSINVGNAKIQGLEKDLHMHGEDYNIAVQLFFIPYILLEVPSNLILKKMRPSVWLSGIMLGWGIITVCQGVTRSYAGLVVCRVLLGIFESGFFPGCIYLISM